MPATLPPKIAHLARLRDLAKVQLTQLDTIWDVDRRWTIALVAFQTVALGAIALVAALFQGSATFPSLIIISLSGAAMAISGYLFGARPFSRWGQYAALRHELHRHLLEVDLYFHADKAFSEEKIQKIEEGLMGVLERQRLVLDPSGEHTSRDDADRARASREAK